MAKRAQDVSQLTREVIQNVEEIVWTVNPKNDSLDRFAAYLCEFSERVVTRAGLRFRWEAPVEIPSIPIASDVRHHLFLVAKEALNNLVRHADASEARVRLAVDGGSLVIAISDDGKGFDFEKCASRGGNGLDNMRDRLKACGGDVNFECRNGSGSSVTFKIPLQAAFGK
jgi:signal transduction histidine kinase